MLTIGSEQLASITETRIRRFAEELATRAERRRVALCDEISAIELRDALSDEIRAARALGFRTRKEMRRFADMALALGFGFSDRLGWAEDILRDERLSPSKRLDKAERKAVFVSMKGA